MHHTGVGALPLLPLPTDMSENPISTEEQIIADTTNAIQFQYEQLNGLKENASTVSNLLNTAELANTRAAK